MSSLPTASPRAAVSVEKNSREEPLSVDSSTGRVSSLPELLAPAGDWECARAAVENGADAIYFGLEKFNARMRAHNFTEADLPRLMEFLHSRGVKAYITFNTLVFENELVQAEQYASSMIAAGVDAAIVQDVGICRLIRRLSPDFPIHASTQMTITSPAGVAFARELGCQLVVLARECSLKEIEKIQAAQNPAATGLAEAVASPLPLEVFIHGALCVAYSGQCLTSEALGGRSANRGECAQACRMPYELIADGQPVPLGDRKYLLSPQDLAGVAVLPDLVRLGVRSLKIEGRLKSPEYVANITRIYRDALDRIQPGVVGTARRPVTPAERDYEMAMAFSRGLYTGWFGGTNNQALVHGRFGKKRGVYLGTVRKVEAERVAVLLEERLKPGDGVVFDAGHPEEEEEGGRVYTVSEKRGEAWLTFGPQAVNFRRVHIGDKLWKTSDPELDRRLRQTYAGDTPRFRRPVTMEVHGFSGKPLTLVVRDEAGHCVRMDSAILLESARTQPLTSARLAEQLGRLGGTPFELGELLNHLEGDVLLPVSELNRVRRAAIDELILRRGRPQRWTIRHEGSKAYDLSGTQAQSPSAGLGPELIVLVRSLPQLEAAVRQGVKTLYCEFEDPKKYRELVAWFRNCAEGVAGKSIFVAPPRIFKPGEDWILKQVRACEADGYLVRNYDHLSYFANDRQVGDFSLNVANHLAADYFKNHFGLERITASYDLNFTQLESLLQKVPPEWVEVTIHQHMPMFHMEHCLFCAFLSEGTDFTNCGRPCDRREVKLRDRVGAEHPIKADAGCRNTVFNSLAQTGAEHVARMLTLGVRFFRLEFLNESPDEVARTIVRYRQLLKGELTGAQLWRELKILSQLGVTRGQLGAIH